MQVEDFPSKVGSVSAEHADENEVTVSRECKENILGRDQLTPKELALAPGGKVFLFHWEKSVETWMEIFHHYGLTSMATCSAGRLPCIVAAIVMNVRALVMCRNVSHLRLLEDDLFQWMLAQSATDEEATFFVSRA